MTWADLAASFSGPHFDTTSKAKANRQTKCSTMLPHKNEISQAYNLVGSPLAVRKGELLSEHTGK